MKLLHRRSRGFSSFAVLTAAATAFSCIGVGLISITEDVASTIKGYANRLHGAYTVEPSGPYLGPHPGRDKGRAVWTQEQIGDAVVGDMYGGLLAGNAARFKQGGGGHPIAVAPASGESYPWEGSQPASSGSVNTGNGDRLTSVPLFSWNARGGQTRHGQLSRNANGG